MGQDVLQGEKNIDQTCAFYQMNILHFQNNTTHKVYPDSFPVNSFILGQFLNDIFPLEININ